YTKDSGFELTRFSDADYAGCKDTFKSTSGGAQFLGEKLLMDYGFHFNKIPIYCDSKSAIAISYNPVQHSRTKHIVVRYHFIKEHVKKGTIKLYFVKTDYQLADIFTKALPTDRFNYLVHRLEQELHQQEQAAQKKEGPPQDSDIRQLIIEECCTKDCREQKKNMEDTMIEFIEVCQQKELYYKEKQEVKDVVERPAERRTRILESLQNFKVIHKSSISLNNTSQISPIHAIAHILSTKEPEYSLSMRYEHLSTTPETELDEVTESSVKNLVPIPSEYEVTSEDKSECDMPVKDEYSPIFTTF
nr:hypothetical protein [Tanacetum cinerariifolium]